MTIAYSADMRCPCLAFAIWLLNATSERELVVGPGGVLTLNGEMTPEQRQQLRGRFSGDQSGQLNPAERAELEEGLEILESVLQRDGRHVGSDPVPQSVAGDESAGIQTDPSESAPRNHGITLSDEGLLVELPWLSEANNRQLEARLQKSIAKIRSDPDGFISDLLENIPQTTLLLVPLFALMMKLLYPFTGRYYVEHLIHALYGHAFLFLAVLLLIGLDQGDARLSAASSAPLQWLGHLLGLLEVLLLFWVPAYFLLSLRVVYGQSWRLTVFKGLFLGFCYLLLFLFGLVSLLLVSVLVS